MGCVIQIVGIMPLFDYARGVGKPLSILEGFVYFSCERYTISAVFLNIVFLVQHCLNNSEKQCLLFVTGQGGGRRQCGGIVD